MRPGSHREDAEHVVTKTLSPSRLSVGRQIEGLRARLAVTPGRLRLAAALLASGAIVFGVLASGAAGSRHRAANSVATETEPLLVQAEGLYASLSDADATATTTFLTGGLEPAARRERYISDLRAAGGQLTALGREVGASAPASAAVRVVSTQLPIYSGLVDTARANNRQGFPVGAAYLREASTLMREQMLPAAGRLYEAQARRLNSDYRSGTSTEALLAVISVALLMLALLALAQVYVARLTHRILNVAMLAATVVLVALSAWTIASFANEQSLLGTAQRTGSDSVQVLSAARILGLRAQDDESLALVARGGGQQNLSDFNAVISRLTGPAIGAGLLPEATAIAERSSSGAAIEHLSAVFVRYLNVHRHVVALETNGKFSDAVNLAVGSGATEVSLSDELNSGLGQQIAAAQQRFDRSAHDATSALGGLWLAIPLLTLLFASLALYGLRQRINEY
jgi:hypothetical protein